MKFTVNWLKQHLNFDASLDELLDILTATGLEVEGVTDLSKVLEPFIVAEVLEAVQHPDADKLRVCKVSTGTEVLQVVCGAPNARTGLKGVFAPSGAHVPGTGLDLKPTKIRGVESNGMLCSERELMMSNEHDGIIDLPSDAPVGTKYTEYAGLNDPMIEVAITPNRQDCLGVFGIARDLAAAGFGTLIEAPVPHFDAAFDSPITIKVDGDACPAFAGRVIRGVKNGPSSKEMQRTLTTIGLRPISALVDVTNYMSYDRARPLHVYDMAKLSGTVEARLAKAGESFVALDGKTYEMTGEECVIADDNGVLGLGGVMGGEASGCTDDTVDVFVESALFDPVRTAMTGRHHGIDSDARYRFERGVDPQAMIEGLEHATKLIIDMCGGEAGEIVVAGDVPLGTKDIHFRPERVKTLGGLDLPADQSIAILERLGYRKGAIKDNAFTMTAPSWRMDVEGEADLVEDVLRIYGYDHVPSTPLPRLDVVAKATLTAGQTRARAARRRLAADGLMESVSWSFMSDIWAKRFGGGQDMLRVDNPISSDLNMMRPSILPNLLLAAARNIDRGAKSVSLFEVGPQYADDTPKGQAQMASGVRVGMRHDRHWASPSEHFDVFDAKACAIAALEAAGAPVDNLMVFSEAADWYHPGRSGTLRLGPKVILAAFGEIHPRILKDMDIKSAAVGFEVYLDAIPAQRKKGASKPALQISDLQAVERDFAFLADQAVAADAIMKAARGGAKQYVKAVRVFDIFDGQGVPEGQKSVAISVTLQPQDKTFTDAEIEKISNDIVQSVAKATGAGLRI